MLFNPLSVDEIECRGPPAAGRPDQRSPIRSRLPCLRCRGFRRNLLVWGRSLQGGLSVAPNAGWIQKRTGFPTGPSASRPTNRGGILSLGHRAALMRLRAEHTRRSAATAALNLAVRAEHDIAAHATRLTVHCEGRLAESHTGGICVCTNGPRGERTSQLLGLHPLPLKLRLAF